jgi:hypothetical protein
MSSILLVLLAFFVGADLGVRLAAFIRTTPLKAIDAESDRRANLNADSKGASATLVAGNVVADSDPMRIPLVRPISPSEPYSEVLDRWAEVPRISFWRWI